MSSFAPRMVVRANVLYIAFVSLPTQGHVWMKRLLVRSRCLSFYYFYVYIIARLSHFSDEAPGGITSSADGTCEESLDEEEGSEVEEQEKEEEAEDEEEEIG